VQKRIQAGSIEAAKAIFDLTRFPSNADMVCDQCGSRQKNRGMFPKHCMLGVHACGLRACVAVGGAGRGYACCVSCVGG
jgi:hypothetical protein